jgi:hypothetical protein
MFMSGSLAVRAERAFINSRLDVIKTFRNDTLP